MRVIIRILSSITFIYTVLIYTSLVSSNYKSSSNGENVISFYINRASSDDVIMVLSAVFFLSLALYPNIMSNLFLFLSRLFSISSRNEVLSSLEAENLAYLKRLSDAGDDAEVAETARLELKEYARHTKISRRTEIWSEEGTIDLDWKGVFAIARTRLTEESERLQARSRANLRWGILTSAMGAMAIGFTIFWPIESARNTSELIVLYLPRVTLVILIQLTSAFFFRMYVSNESDIKQNKNEITNIEQKFAASLLIEEDKAAKAEISKQLSRDERNFILKKGEKTSGESWRTEVGDLKDYLALIADKITAVGKKE